ncbi:MFS transporter [Longispora albida]|uniref:MFS transporter n=1 Tax=Longispora albida TaxID=203523 RepID=UPI00036CCC3C|nr:MFS transporter [Longispora albida]
MRDLFANRRFMTFWLGQAVSVLGDGMTPIAMATLVLAHYGKSAFGLVLACYSVGFAVATLFGGVIADRYSRTLVMALGDAIRLSVVVGYVLLAGKAPLAVLGTLSVLGGLGSALYLPAFRASLSQLLEPEQLRQANAMQGLLNKGAFALGGALAGLLVATVGPKWAFAVDGATFAISIVTLLFIRLPRVGERPSGANPFREFFGELADGVRAVWARPWVAVVMGQGTVQVLAGFAPIAVLLPIVALDRYGAAGYGALAFCQGAGSVVGSLLMLRYRPKLPGLSAMHAVALFAPMCLGLALPLPLWIYLGFQVLGAAGISVFFALWISALQQEFPAELQGRVFSLDTLLTFVLNPIGLALTPWLAGVIGVPALGIGAAIVIVFFSYVVLVVPGVAAFRTPPHPSTPAAKPAQEPSLSS